MDLKAKKASKVNRVQRDLKVTEECRVPQVREGLWAHEVIEDLAGDLEKQEIKVKKEVLENPDHQDNLENEVNKDRR